MNGANEIATVKDGAREVALKKLREIREKNLEGATSMRRKAQRELAKRAFISAFRGLCKKLFFFGEEDFTKLTAEDFYEIHKNLKKRAKIYSRIQFAAALFPIVGWIWFAIECETYGHTKYWRYHRTSKFLEKEYGPDWFQKIVKDLYN